MTEDKIRKPWTAATFAAALLGSASALALHGAALAQDAEETDEEFYEPDTIVVTGIRRSLAASSDIKRDGQGIVDAITAEDMGKFPDTNLAESLQRITGVSIDRRNGEGSTVTVRGFGPTYNLVLLNGRQMPTAFLEGGAPASRSFDFADIASEGIAGVRVYKTGRAALPTGGIGSTLNVLTTRPFDAPGLRATIGAKAVVDNSGTTLGDETTVRPDVSGLFSNTFADDTIGISVAGAYQERTSGFAQFGTTNGWRGAYRGDENNWGTLPRDGSVDNRPEDDEIYSVPQNGNYSLNQLDRTRINGLVTLQYRPIDTLTGTLDYFYSENELDRRTSDMSVWFNHGATDSAWTDGDVADILFYGEDFGENGTDLSMGAARVGTRSEKNSLGGNVEWEATDNLTFTLDGHTSSAESGSNSPFGSTGVISTADFSLNFQQLDFRPELPTLSLGWFDPFDDISRDRMRGTGSTFQDSFIRTEIDQARLFAQYEFDSGIVESIDFGVEATRNDYRATFSNNQRDSWGGVGSPEDYPDDIWERVDLASNFDQFDGQEETFQDFFVVDFDALFAVLDSGNPPGDSDPVCGGDGICINDTPLATDRRTTEESYAGFVEIATAFDLGRVPATLVGGVRYDRTDVTSEALAQVPIGTQFVSANEFGLIFADEQDFTQLEGEYDFWLPAVDFEIRPDDGWVLRSSYSHTITRPSYANLQGGIGVAQLFRVDGGVADAGNPGLLPLLSKNFDLSTEYYYGEGSYISAGYFYKRVENFIGQETTFGNELFDGLVTPFGGERYDEAVEALGSDEDINAIRQYIFQNADPSTFNITGVNPETGLIEGQIFGVPGEDPTLEFRFTQPFNNDQTQEVKGWEFAWQNLLGDSGFGYVLNYTVVDGDVEFNNLVVPSDGVFQTPLTGLSDSANIVGFYEKDGVSVRAAYNWRGQFLASPTGISGTPDNPLYVESYEQLDINASYEFNDRVSVFVEGINVTDETQRTVGRTDAYVNFAVQNGSRYNIGARYRF